MRFLVIQENGRHDKNREFRECFSIQRSLLALGNECDVWGKGHKNFCDSPNLSDYDVIFDVENYDFGWIPSLSCVKAKKIFWAIDTHCRPSGFYERKIKEHKYDIVFQATRQFAKSSVEWLPNCYDSSLINNMNITRNYDVGFCGNIVNRGRYLDCLDKFGLKRDIFVIGEDMVRAVNSYKIHFNFNINGDINYRNFETVGCGTLLLTNYDSQYEALGFIDGDNCIMYKTINEMVEKVGALVGNDAEINRIAANGYKLSKKHSYFVRMEQMLKRIT